MIAKTHTTHMYLVQGTYLVKYSNGKGSKKESGRKLIQADSELKAIMAAARDFIAGHNYAMFTWLKVKAECVDK